MKNEFTLAFNEVIDDKQLPQAVVMEALEAAMISAYRKAVNASNAQQVIAKIDPENGKVRIFAEKEVVDQVHDYRTEVSLEHAKAVDSEIDFGNMVVVETTPHNFGRVAAQTARQVIQQRIREAERDAQFNYYSNQIGEIVNGIVQATNPNFITLGLDKRAEGIMPRIQQISGERFRVHDRVRALLLETKQTPRGPQITLSRAHRDYLRRLLEDEVPEIYHGLVEIRSISREPGQRSKVVVAALQAGIDPVGACVGVRGVRIQAIVRELNDEKIDVIEWNPETTEYIAKALSPARVVGVYLDKHTKRAKTATVVVPEDQLSLAIGRNGQNARLAAKLTGWRIDIKSLPEAAADTLQKLQTDPVFTEAREREEELVPQIEIILVKKEEGRPVTPEEYQVLSHFVNRVELTGIKKRDAVAQAKKDHRQAIRASVPDVAFKIPLEDINISPRFCILLSGEGYPTAGDMLFQMALNPDAILALNGIGPKAMTEIEAAIANIDQIIAPYKEAAEAKVAEEEGVTEVEVITEAKAGPTPDEAAEAVAAAPVTETQLVEESPVTEVAPETDVDAEADEEPDTEESKEETQSLDDLFTLQPGVLDIIDTDDEEILDPEADKKKKKKRKKRFVEMEYDPDHDVMLVKRRRKRGSQQDWMDELEED